jgi:GNAT superfamily N-acetyltransferase
VLRAATTGDLDALNRIAFEAKAHWGYGAALMDAWRAELGTTADAIAARPTCVAELDGRPVAWAQVDADGTPWRLEALWVSPSHLRRGLGRALLGWARERAALAGQRALAIDADPNAAGFYLACGARPEGAVPAPIDGQPGRMRPQLVLPTAWPTDRSGAPGRGDRPRRGRPDRRG